MSSLPLHFDCRMQPESGVGVDPRVDGGIHSSMPKGHPESQPLAFPRPPHTTPSPAVNVYMPKDRVTNEHQGYGFVEFRSEEDADYAIKASLCIILIGGVCLVLFGSV